MEPKRNSPFHYPQPEREQQDKEWGTDEVIFAGDSVRVHRLEIKKGGKSTNGNFHKHRHKYNKFYVESGILHIYVESANEKYFFEIGDDCDFRSVSVYPNNLHRFEAITHCIVYEIYWTNCTNGDIIRFDSEGKMIPFKRVQP